ncbi:MAG TPA: hypothetical protein VEV61_19945 [Streptosporangiaceae bacterium]|nr:hypothetical protein [Streptosporangiaceae bacterium]
MSKKREWRQATAVDVLRRSMSNAGLGPAGDWCGGDAPDPGWCGGIEPPQEWCAEAVQPRQLLDQATRAERR